MKLYWITVMHMRPAVLKSTRTQLEVTTTQKERDLFDKKVFVDNRYPLNKGECTEFINEWADDWGAIVMRPARNVGGHGGVTMACEALLVQDDDLVLNVDPDSYPITHGWITAMVETMRADPTLGQLSLMIEVLKERSWRIGHVDGRRVAALPHPEMINVTMLRGRALGSGLLAARPFYGFVETEMSKKLKELGLRSGYLMDFVEGLNPVAHDEVYNQWKKDHAGGKFYGNFDAYVSIHGGGAV